MKNINKKRCKILIFFLNMYDSGRNNTTNLVNIRTYNIIPLKRYLGTFLEQGARQWASQKATKRDA